MVALVPAQISKLRYRLPTAPLRHRSVPLPTTHHPLSSCLRHLRHVTPISPPSSDFSRHSPLNTRLFPLPNISLPALSSTYKSLSSHHRFATLPLSAAYKSLFSQPLCFLIDTKPRGLSGRRLSIFNLCASASAPAPTRSGWPIPLIQGPAASLSSLCALFHTPSFVFKSLQPLLPKHPGWGYLNTAAPRFTSDVICATWRRYPLWTHSIARILPVTTRVHPFARTRHCSLPTTHFCFKRGRRCWSPCAGRKAAHRPAQTPPQPQTRPSLRPAAARVRSAPTGIRQ